MLGPWNTCVSWGLISSKQKIWVEPGLGDPVHHPHLPSSNFQEKNTGVWASRLWYPSIIHTHTIKTVWSPWLVHTCCLFNIFSTQVALSFRETTAWFGARARWQLSASFTGFLVPSLHSTSKSSLCRFFAHASLFLSRFRKGASAKDQNTLTGRCDHPPLACWGAGPSGQQRFH